MSEDERPAEATVHRLPPLVTPSEPIEVVVLEDGEWWPGFAKHWRGERTYVEYSKGIGMKHLGWFPADRVRRVE